MSAGKRFEGQVLRSLRHHLPQSWSHRNTDAMTGNGRISVQSPPDIITVDSKCNLLIECKAVKGTSLPFNRLADHQKEHLIAFDDTRHDSFGVVAILHYNGLRGKERKYDCYLLPIQEWCSLERALDRKSLPLAAPVAGYLYPYFAPWDSKSAVFDIRSALHTVTGKRF